MSPNEIIYVVIFTVCTFFANRFLINKQFKEAKKENDRLKGILVEYVTCVEVTFLKLGFDSHLRETRRNDRLLKEAWEFMDTGTFPDSLYEDIVKPQKKEKEGE